MSLKTNRKCLKFKTKHAGEIFAASQRRGVTFISKLSVKQFGKVYSFNDIYTVKLG